MGSQCVFRGWAKRPWARGPWKQADPAAPTTTTSSTTTNTTTTALESALFEWLASSGSLTALAGGVEVEAVFSRGCERVGLIEGLYVPRDNDDPVFIEGRLEILPELLQLWSGANVLNNPGPYGTGVDYHNDGAEDHLASATGVAGQNWHSGLIPTDSGVLQVVTAAGCSGPYASLKTLIKSGQYNVAVLGVVWVNEGGSPVAATVAVISTLTGEVVRTYAPLGGDALPMLISVRPLAGGVFEVVIIQESPEGAVSAAALYGAPINADGDIYGAGDGVTVSTIYGCFASGSTTCYPFELPFVNSLGTGTYDLAADNVSWPTPETVQDILASVGALELRLSFGQGVGLLPDGSILSTGAGSAALFMDSGNLCASDGVETASVAFEPDYGVEYDLRTEWGSSGLRVGWKLSSGESYTWSSYVEFSGAMPDNEALTLGGINWPLYPVSIKID